MKAVPLRGGGPETEGSQQQQPEQLSQRQTLFEDASISTRMLSQPLISRSRVNLLASLADASQAAPPRISSISGGNPLTASNTQKQQHLRGREESGEESDVGTDEGDDTGDIFGNLKTQLLWDTVGRRLLISARQYLETPRKLELKMRGLLDTASGQHRVRGHARRNFYTHVPLLQRLLAAQSQRQAGGWVDEPDLDPEGWLPGGLRCLLFQDWVLAPGLSYDTARLPAVPYTSPRGAASAASSVGGAATVPATGVNGTTTESSIQPPSAAPGVGSGGLFSSAAAAATSLLGQPAVRYQLAIKKNPQVIKNSGTADVWLQAKALAEYDPKASELTLGGSVRLKAVRYAVTAGGQDLRLSVGLDVAHDENGRLAKMPYIHVSDGKLGAKLQNRRWLLSYAI
ncbi:hypothetical protein Agub_g3734 [Astrephomene gubernaculifera]|uniref:Uncharacterized protein n=1 Tax=Astrephomene gubernaculifera TaxID=47775 RepID=A0AAD3DLD9_9CHLO|nr:hypothetical protein Agub_g3734 [Astrephomene gubernaculifera]